MSDTPRTESKKFMILEGRGEIRGNVVVPVELAEYLERENAELSDELKELHEDSEGDAEQILMLTQRVETLTRENEKLQEGGGVLLNDLSEAGRTVRVAEFDFSGLEPENDAMQEGGGE